MKGVDIKVSAEPESDLPEIATADAAPCSSGFPSPTRRPGAGSRVIGIVALMEFFMYASTARTPRASVALIAELNAAGIDPA